MKDNRQTLSWAPVMIHHAALGLMEYGNIFVNVDGGEKCSR
ncbi:hypothetical protein KYC5002_12805 [Archangium violaceum]|nr:hypothetical protein KYC5002_12805 [Archangium gephyra]